MCSQQNESKSGVNLVILICNISTSNAIIYIIHVYLIWCPVHYHTKYVNHGNDNATDMTPPKGDPHVIKLRCQN